MNIDAILDVLTALLLIAGALLSVTAGIGVLRFPDALSRLHAATKPQTLGLAFVLVAVALTARSWSTTLVIVPVLLFQALLAPIASHMVGRAGYRTDNFRKDVLLVDELDEDVEAASLESGSLSLESPSDTDATDAARGVGSTDGSGSASTA
jgi:multicomponent Na+:H+ antiporter subunit G